MACQQRVLRHRPHNLQVATYLLFYSATHQGGIDIDNPPATDLSAHRYSVVDLSGIAKDNISREGLHLSDGTPRTLRPKIDHAKPKLIVRMSREMVIRGEGHSLDPRHS